MRRLFRSKLKNLRYDPKLLKVLELNPENHYDQKHIKKQYLKLTKKYHPDIAKETKKFLEIKEAYEEIKQNPLRTKTFIHPKKDQQSHYTSTHQQFYQQYQDYEYKQKYDEFVHNNQQERRQSQVKYDIFYMDSMLQLFGGAFLVFFFLYWSNVIINRIKTLPQREKFIERRFRVTRHLEDLSEEEMDEMDIQEMIDAELSGYKKIPDRIFLKFVEHSFNELIKYYNQ